MSDIINNTRVQQILNTLIARYIQEGQPVGSKALVADAALNISSATVRNIMADLENEGYLISPHTSAGRIPTIKGYRFFVDTLLKAHSIPGNHMNDILNQLNKESSSKELISTASEVLSSLTHLAGIVTVPKREHMVLRHLEFLNLSQSSILVVLVFNDRDVQNRIINIEHGYTSSQLEEIGNYLNHHYSGMEMHEIRKKILQEMDSDHQEIQSSMQSAIKMAQVAFEETKTEDCVVSGESNLLDLAEIAGIDRMRSIFEAFSQKHEILKLFDQCLNTQGVQIFIGNESGFEIFGECSVVTAPYSVEGEILGYLGVVGPTRMDYERAISTVEVTANMLSNILGVK